VYQPVEQQTINVAIGIFAVSQCLCFNGRGSSPKLNNEIACCRVQVDCFYYPNIFMETAFNPILL